jgi:hypothetical protein
MSELTEFLLARIAEDEELARGAHYDGQRWYSEEEFVGRYPDCCDCGCEVMMGANRKIEAAHVANWDPARVLAECAAKRAIVALHRPDDLESSDRGMYFYAEGAGDAVKALAAVYKDHPDYQSEWANH